MSGPSEQAERAETARLNREKRKQADIGLKKRILGQWDSESTPITIARALGISRDVARRLLAEMGLHVSGKRAA